MLSEPVLPPRHPLLWPPLYKWRLAFVAPVLLGRWVCRCWLLAVLGEGGALCDSVRESFSDIEQERFISRALFSLCC